MAPASLQDTAPSSRNAHVASYGSLFTGGCAGLDLAVEAVTGAECAWQCEADEWRRGVLERHWGPIQYDDVRAMELHDDGCRGGPGCFCGHGVQPVDMIAGGFPCPDVATNGKREGIDGERSGLWGEFARLVRVLRPGYVFVENVPGLLARGMGRVLGDLAELGFDAEWVSVRASEAAGALHPRLRVFILAHAHQERPRGPVGARGGQPRGAGFGGGSVPSRGTAHRSSEWSSRVGWDPLESGVGRVAHGLPAGLARRQLAAYGDAVCPQQAAWALAHLLDRYAQRGDR
jgi:DNA (cytosine-5)-methyltransferase 1